MIFVRRSSYTEYLQPVSCIGPYDKLCESLMTDSIWRGLYIRISPQDNSVGVAIEFFTNSPQYKNANIANLVLDVPLGIDHAIEVYNLEM